MRQIAVLGIWFALGFLDFATGFVEYSPFRLFLLLILALPLLPYSIQKLPALAKVIGHIERRPVYDYAFLVVLTLLGYSLFLSRYLRGANMADDEVFRQVIDNTAHGCFFCFPAFGGSYFAGHNNLFLVLFVPLTAFPFWWPLVHLLHSFAIVLWCRVCGWSLGGSGALGWLATTALFLATWTQHAAFYDARFAALTLALFAVGFYLHRSKLMAASALLALPTRETSGLTLFMFGILGWVSGRNKKLLAAIGLVGLLWWVGSYFLILRLGGPILPRFDSCLRLSSTQVPSLACVVQSLTTDWSLKAAYTLRLARFAPTVGALPSFFAALPDFVFTWLSKDNVLYSLSWHYYVQTLGILVVGAGLALRRKIVPAFADLRFRWVVATCLWQFATLFRPNLF